MICPNRQELSDFLLGKLAEPVIESVGRHVDDCANCRTAIASLASTDDPFVAQLKQVRNAIPITEAARKASASLSQSPLGETKISSSSVALLPFPQPPSGQPMTMNCAAFAEAACRLGLLDQGEASSITCELPPEKRDDAQAAAKLFVERSKLTKYQAAAIYQGKAGSLSYGDYVVIDRIGAGGMGQVFKARHRRMNRIVALKVMSPTAMKNVDAVKRFEREVRAVSHLSHPNIVAAYDAGSQDGAHYLVMELVDGPDLSSLLKGHGRMPVKQVVDYIAQAARGLAFAHGKGVVHRDIKPGNLLVNSAGTVKLLDLGLARFDQPGMSIPKTQAELTNSGAVMGTVDYMAPEQALNTRHADAKSDVYGLGCTMYRLLTGETLYRGESMVEKILAHREQPVPSLRKARPEVPPALDALFQRMVAKKPDDRPAMQEIADALGSLDGETLPANGAVSLSPENVFPRLSQATAETIAAPIMQTMTIAAPASVLAQNPTPAQAKSLEFATVRTKGSAPPRRRSSLTFAAAAGAGAIFISLGVWFIFRDKAGNETARVQMADGGTVQTVVVEKVPAIVGPSATAAPRPSGTGPSSTGPGGLVTPPPSTSKPTTIAAVSLPPAVVAPPSGDLWIYGDPYDKEVLSVVVDGLTYDASTPLTIECWAMPYATPSLLAAADAEPNKKMLVPLYGFDHKDTGSMQFGLRWEMFGSDAARDKWFTGERKFVRGLKIGGASSAAAAKRNVPTHVAMVVDAPAGAEQTLTLWIDGKLIRTTKGEFAYIPDGKLLSQGFFDELRVSKAARYAAEFKPERRFEPDADTLALYHCDEGSGDRLVDASDNNRDGKLTNVKWAPVGAAPGTPLIASAAPNPTVSAVANAYVGAPVVAPAGNLWVYSEPQNMADLPIVVDSLRYDGTAPLTMEAWYMPEPTSAFNKLKNMSGFYTLQLFGFGHVRSTANAPAIQLYSDGAASPDNRLNAIINLTAQNLGASSYQATWIREWKQVAPGHVAMVFGTQKNGLHPATVFYDGKRVQHGEYPLHSHPQSPLISHGYFDELRISSSVRYMDDFKPQRRFEPDADTFALYHCDEGSGELLIDASGNKRHGKLTNVKWAPVGFLPGTPVLPK